MADDYTQYPIFNQANSGVLEIIEKAAKRNQVVIINYVDGKGSQTTREVEPYEFNQNGLYAYSLDKNAIRLFKYERIIAAMPTNKTFVPRWDIKI